LVFDGLPQPQERNSFIGDITRVEELSFGYFQSVRIGGEECIADKFRATLD
jgi:hypothetical protein